MSLPASVCLHGKRGQMNNRRQRALLKQIAGGGGLPPFVDNPVGVELIDYNSKRTWSYRNYGGGTFKDDFHYSYAPIRVNPGEKYWIDSIMSWDKGWWGAKPDSPDIGINLGIAGSYEAGGRVYTVPDGMYWLTVNCGSPRCGQQDYVCHCWRVEE